MTTRHISVDEYERIYEERRGWKGSVRPATRGLGGSRSKNTPHAAGGAARLEMDVVMFPRDMAYAALFRGDPRELSSRFSPSRCAFMRIAVSDRPVFWATTFAP